jgi:hypothetical protein
MKCVDVFEESVVRMRALLADTLAGATVRIAGRVATLVTDSSLLIRQADEATCVLLDRTPRELVGVAVAELVALPDRRRFGIRLCELLENPAKEWQTRLILPRSRITISVGVSVAVADSGQPRRLGWMIRDLRGLRRAQTELLLRQQAGSVPTGPGRRAGESRGGRAPSCWGHNSTPGMGPVASN